MLHSLTVRPAVFAMALIFDAGVVGPAAGIASAQRIPSREWTSDVRLTADPSGSGLSFNFARSLAVDETGALHVVWFDSRGDRSRVSYKQSRDGGETWSGDIPLSDGSHSAAHPAIAIAGPDVYVAWHELHTGGPHISLKHSRNRGMTWEAAVRLTADMVLGAHASVAASGRDVHVVWGGGSEGSPEVYIRSSSDRGATWMPPTRVSERPYASWVGSVEASGKHVYVAWVDYADANEEEYIRHSADGGATWDQPVRLTGDAADSWASSLALSHNLVHIAWFDRRDADLSDAEVETRLNRVLSLLGLDVEPSPPRDPRVYYLDPFMARVQQKITSIGARLPSWVQAGGDSRQFEALFGEFQQAMLAWSTGWEIYYKRSADGGVTWGPDVRLTRAPGMSARPSLAVASDGSLHVVWFDGRDGQSEVYYKESRDAGLSWQPDKRLTVAAGDSVLPSIAVSRQGVHVVWIDHRDGDSELYYKRRNR